MNDSTPGRVSFLVLSKACEPGCEVAQELAAAAGRGEHDPQQQQQLQVHSAAQGVNRAGLGVGSGGHAPQAPPGILQLLEQLHGCQGSWSGLTVCLTQSFMNAC